VRDVIKPIDRITWDVQIGGLLDLKSLAWNGCSAMWKRWEVMRGVKRREKIPADSNSKCQSIVS
jgi:hypothetical protein